MARKAGRSRRDKQRPCGHLPIIQSGLQWRTWNFTLLFSVAFGPVTATKPVVAPAGTVAEIRVLDSTVNTAGVPLKLTPVASVKSLPRIWIASPTSPELSTVSINGGRPAESA